MSERLDALKKATAIQCSDGNWNYDHYMHGMANGMIYAVSCLDGTEPKFLDAPATWGKYGKTADIQEVAG